MTQSTWREIRRLLLRNTARVPRSLVSGHLSADGHKFCSTLPQILVHMSSCTILCGTSRKLVPLTIAIETKVSH